MDCAICRKPIVLVPSARERVAKDVAGNGPSFYESLFISHSDCQINQRTDQSSRLMRALACKPYGGQ